MISCLDFCPLPTVWVPAGGHATACRRAPWTGTAKLVLPPHRGLCVASVRPNHGVWDHEDFAGMSLASGVVIGPFRVVRGLFDVAIELFNPTAARADYTGAAIILISADVEKT